MAIKDKSLADFLQRALSEEYKVELGEGVVVRFGRLTVNDFVKLDEELGTNIFAEMMEAAQKGGAVPKVWSYRFQRKLLTLSLAKFEPEITEEEAGMILSLLPIEKFGEILSWVLAGIRPGEAPPLAMERSSG